MSSLKCDANPWAQPTAAGDFELDTDTRSYYTDRPTIHRRRRYALHLIFRTNPLSDRFINFLSGMRCAVHIDRRDERKQHN
jgi:hypothetical protein